MTDELPGVQIDEATPQPPGFGDFDVFCRHEGEVFDRHDWDSSHVSRELRKCRRCGVGALEHLAAATQARGRFFQTLKAPASCHGTAKKR